VAGGRGALGGNRPDYIAKLFEDMPKRLQVIDNGGEGHTSYEAEFGPERAVCVRCSGGRKRVVCVLSLFSFFFFFEEEGKKGASDNKSSSS